MKKSISLYHKLLGSKKLKAHKLLYILALADAREMKQNREYAKQVRFIPNTPSLLMAFKWNNTDSGFDIWKMAFNVMMGK